MRGMETTILLDVPQPHEDAGHIGTRLKQLREAHGLTQQELAVAADVSVSIVFQIEQGRQTNPKIATLLALAGALGVSVSALLSAPKKRRSD
jgi:transcriptional regulator with XRE-family HTH domain